MKVGGAWLERRGGGTVTVAGRPVAGCAALGEQPRSAIQLRHARRGAGHPRGRHRGRRPARRTRRSPRPDSGPRDARVDGPHSLGERGCPRRAHSLDRLRPRETAAQPARQRRRTPRRPDSRSRDTEGWRRGAGRRRSHRPRSRLMVAIATRTAGLRREPAPGGGPRERLTLKVDFQHAEYGRIGGYEQGLFWASVEARHWLDEKGGPTPGLRMGDAFYEPLAEGRFASSASVVGPWDPGTSHGSPPAALLLDEIQRTHPRPDARVARIAFDFFGPVPVAELAVTCSLVRPGARVELSRARLTAAGRTVMEASAWRIAVAGGGRPTWTIRARRRSCRGQGPSGSSSTFRPSVTARRWSGGSSKGGSTRWDRRRSTRALMCRCCRG